jgi:hypothetical protein
MKSDINKNHRNAGMVLVILGLVLTLYGYYPYLVVQSLIDGIMSQPGGCLGTVDACAEIPLMYQGQFPGYEAMMVLGPLLIIAGLAILKFSKPGKR